MTLDYIVEDISELEEALRPFYVEADGKHVLDVAGVKPLEEFQKVHGALEKERGLHKAAKKTLLSFGETKPEDILSFQDQIEELTARAGEMDEEKMQTILEARVAPHLRKNEKLTETLAERDAAILTLQDSIHSADREKTLRNLVDDRIQPCFMKDLLLRAKGEIKRDTETGEFGDSDGTTLEDWVNRQLEETPLWNLPSNGGGAGGGKNKGKGNANPWLKGEGWNLSEQMRITTADPVKAERLQSQAK